MYNSCEGENRHQRSRLGYCCAYEQDLDIIIEICFEQPETGSLTG
jgi:hypothetical protein